MLTVSKPVEGFLDFLREARSAYNIAQSEENDANNATQDILHSLELEDHRYHDYARLSSALRDVRRQRREAKDSVQRLQPLMDWIDKNNKTIKEMERLLGDIRKAETSTENRHYNNKTDIVQQTIGGKNETPETRQMPDIPL